MRIGGSTGSFRFSQVCRFATVHVDISIAYASCVNETGALKCFVFLRAALIGNSCYDFLLTRKVQLLIPNKATCLTQGCLDFQCYENVGCLMMCKHKLTLIHL